ncbi:GntR family transcriptional regulator [Streptomyces sp. 110]|uniref:GntR family transcriptional regulator n=1 Tax=Streptomyces endocoffeicus TaxID=2898945 RepID=A0ABS1PVI8_9ACTN|nr:GntR family transcriptional regulator [Streptomyces endocoffeicus]MBL1116442.1 GntR family transcriptional regulator [Streptomyces endocoffeicus]
MVAEIRRAILGGDMPPGVQIFQDELASQFGVSRVPVRDALRLLQGEGLISYAPHAGYHVAQLDVEQLLEIQNVREILETEALSVGVPRIADETVETMSAAFDEMARCEADGDLASWVEAHRAFHFVLFEAAAMPHLMRILGRVWDASDLYRSHYMHADTAQQRAHAEHHAILEAARARDLEALLTLMRGHRQSTVAAIHRSVTGESKPEADSNP